ncbi:MAG: ROK family protein [Planctomycetaceae bacterium]|jgi:glucokinase|nr:ROK family protein [Planctomycetaceae bacterium]
MPAERTLITVKEAKSPFYVGVDVGGTSIKIGIVDDFGRPIDTGDINEAGEHRRVIAIKTEPQPQTAAALMSEAILDLLKRVGIDKKQCGGIGLGIPSTMDKKTHKLRQPPNLHTWEGFAMTDELAKLSGLPTFFANDANAAAFGEYWVGSGSGQPSIALLTLGTGIGTGIIIDGKMVDGTNGYGGECGHLVIDCSEDALLCGCGQRGHLEAYCSATGVARRTLNQTGTRESSIRSKITPETKLSDVAKIVFQEAERGDTLAQEIIDDTARFLSLGIVSILNTVDAECIVLGGAMTFGGKGHPVGQRFLQKVSQEVKSRSFPAVAANLTIDFAVLGGDAGYIGAAGIARAEVNR